MFITFHTKFYLWQSNPLSLKLLARKPSLEFKSTRKIRDIRSVWNLFISSSCEFYYDDVITMTSVALWTRSVSAAFYRPTFFSHFVSVKQQWKLFLLQIVVTNGVCYIFGGEEGGKEQIRGAAAPRPPWTTATCLFETCDVRQLWSGLWGKMIVLRRSCAPIDLRWYCISFIMLRERDKEERTEMTNWVSRRPNDCTLTRIYQWQLDGWRLMAYLVRHKHFWRKSAAGKSRSGRASEVLT